MEENKSNLEPKKQKNPFSTYKLWLIMIIAGIVFLILGFCTKIPSTELSTYSLDDKYEVEEYFNGDVYNYIIAAEICAGELVSATIEKYVSISIGALLTTLGLIMLLKGKRQEEEKETERSVVLALKNNPNKTNE